MTGRRDFLASVLAGAAVLAIAPGITLVASAATSNPVSPGRRWGLLIDAGRCPEGCDTCIGACKTEQGWTGHGLGAADPQWLRKVEVSDPASGVSRSLPVMCQHCASPPCADVCPTGASFRRDDGIVLVDRHLCIGCRYCIMACPFKARFFVHETLDDQSPHTPRGKGTTEGCTLCVHRIDAGRLPACVEACQSAGAAMIFGNLNDSASPIARALASLMPTRLRPDLRLGTAIAYHGL